MAKRQDIILPTRIREVSNDFLTPSVNLSPVQNVFSVPHDTQNPSLSHPGNSSSSSPLRTPRDVLAILKSQPSLSDLQRCLAYLEEPHDQDDSESISGDGSEPSGGRFHVRLLGPVASQIVFTLVNEVAPAYWTSLRDDDELRATWRAFVRCLKSVAGIGAVTTRLQALCKPAPPSTGDAQGSHNQQQTAAEHIQATLQMLECILHGDATVDAIWRDITQLETGNVRVMMVMDRLTSALAGGSVLSTAAQAQTKLTELSKDVVEASWTTDGRRYGAWLGRNIYHWSRRIMDAGDEAGGKARDRLLSRALSLGYNEQMLAPILIQLVSGSPEELKLYQDMTRNLATNFQSAMLNALLSYLSDKAPEGDPTTYIAGVSALLYQLTRDRPFLCQKLARWVADPASSSGTCSLQLIRAVVVYLGQNQDLLKQAHELCLKRFGSKVNINRDPILRQQRVTKIFLILSAMQYRRNASVLKQMKSSSDYLNAISNRLAASSPRAQFFGMIVGSAISELIDTSGSKLVFNNAEVEGEGGQFYRYLLKLNDNIGTIQDLAKLKQDSAQPEPTKTLKSKAKTKPPPAKPQSTKAKIVAIEEVSGTDSSDDDLPTYAKPDSDAEDSDDDPTLINRNKAKAPVYIRDLLAGLADNENHDRHRLAVETAPSLIRRKTTFGTEVTEHLEELAVAVIGLKDVNLSHGDDDDADSDQSVQRSNTLRLQALVAVTVAGPEKMGPWLANTFFNGDYSQAQRSSILTTLALAARELAGLGDEDADLTGAATTGSTPSFPSKRLPPSLESAFLAPSSSLNAAHAAAQPISRLSGRAQRAILQPLALSAADAATGPNALKVRTFSSRLRDPARAAARSRTVPNRLAGLVATSFFYPLTSRWRALLGVSAHGGASGPFAAPFLLAQFVRSLALILAAAGTGTLSLQGMTAEFWALLLGLRGWAGGKSGGGDEGGDFVVVEALLFGFLTILDLNADRARDIAQDHAQEMSDMREWVAAVFENVGDGGGVRIAQRDDAAPPTDDERVRLLAAGVMVKADELVDKYRRELLGGMAVEEMLG